MLEHLAVGLLAAALSMSVPGLGAKVLNAYSGTFADLGTNDAAVPFITKDSGTPTGTKRISDRGYAIAINSGWGARATFTKAYDFTSSFSFKVDLSLIPNDSTFVATLSTSVKDPYPTTGVDYIIMDFVKSASDATSYCMTLSNTGNHNVSMTGTDWPTTAWSGNSAYSGLGLTVADGVFTVSFASSNGSTVIGVNGTNYTVPSATLCSRFPSGSDFTKLYMSAGIMNTSGTHDFVMDQIGDATDEVYYGTTGAYTIQKGYVDNLAAKVSAGLDTIEKLNAAKAVKANIDLTTLYDFDKAYLDPSYEASVVALNNATTLLGNDAIIADYEDVVNAFKTAADGDLSTTTLIDSAIAKYNAIADKKAAVTAVDASLNSTQKTKVTDLDGAVTAEYAKLVAGITSYYNGTVTAYETACSDLSTPEKASIAAQAKAAILGKYGSYLSEADKKAADERVTAADAKFATGAHTAPDGWSIGNFGYCVNETDKLGFVSENQFFGTDQLDLAGTNALVYKKEALSTSDFTLKLDIKKWSTVDGSWFSLGLMEHPGYFSAADDDTVQNNKGVFFLMRANVGGTTITIEEYINTLTCNRFFDALQATKIEIPMSSKLEVKFAEETEEVAGVSDSYFVASFNGVKMNGDHIKATKIKTALNNADKAGYLYVGANAATTADPMIMDITDVNGHKPLEASLVKAKAPSTSDTSKDYVIGSNSDLTLNFDGQGQEVTEVKLGSTILTSADYVVDAAAKTITIKASALAKIATSGSVDVVITTAGGSVTVPVVFKASVPSSSQPESSTSSSGSGTSSSGNGGTAAKNDSKGVIIGCSVGAAVLVVGGIVFFVIRKKHAKK